jgi:hypothetical protein
VAKLEDEEPAVQEAASELVAAFLRGVKRIGARR